MAIVMKEHENIQGLFDLLKRIRFIADVANSKTDGLEYIKNMPCLNSQYLYVCDYTKGKIVFSKGTFECLGYSEEEITVELIMGFIHPDDIDIVVALAEFWIDEAITKQLSPNPFELIATYDYRVRKKDGNYIRIMRQTSVLEKDNQGRMVSTLSICTDISSIKKSNEITYRFEGPCGEESTKKIDKLLGRRNILSNRELEVVELLAKGYINKQIADKLFISVNTVRHHRQNIMEKLNVKNMAELSLHAFQRGIIKS